MGLGGLCEVARGIFEPFVSHVAKGAPVGCERLPGAGQAVQLHGLAR